MNPPDTPAVRMTEGRAPCVLIVDDQPVNLEVVGAVLGKIGCEIVVATDGPSALKRVALRPVDLILLDLNMPGMNGYEVCDRLRETENKEIPVIFLSATSEKELVVRALDSGGVDYITKPFNQAELTSRVRTQLELKLARDRLKQLAEDKDELLGILAHDLKNQLGGIQMSAQLLQSRLLRAQKADNKIQQLADNIEFNSGQLLSFVRGFLANIAAEHGIGLKPQPVNLAEIVPASVENLRELARRKDIEIQFTNAAAAATAVADPSALTQVLDNLISNAVKFSPPDKTVTVVIREAGSKLEISIQDEGPGFTDEDKARMFRRYAKLSARPTAGEPSSGLGLSIVRKLVLAMNGEIACASSAGHGATFSVKLPKAT